MVTYIPGPEQLLAPAAQQIGQAVAHLINPNREAQQALQMSVARNPQLLQQLADAEFAAPGTMERLGFGNIGRAAAALPASPQQEFAINNRQQVVKGLEIAQNVDILKNTLTGQNIDKVTQYMANNPKAGFEAAMKAVMGVTPSEIVVKQGEAAKAAATTDVLESDPEARKIAGTIGATGMAPSSLSAEQNKIAAQNRAAEMIRQGMAITFDAFKAGKYNAGDLNAIMSTPMGEALKLQVDMYNAEQRAKFANGDNDAMARLRFGKAFDLFTKIRGSSIDAVEAWMYDKDAKARADYLVENPTEATTAKDKDLLAVAQQVNQWDDEQRRTQLSALSKDLLSQRSAFQQTLLPTERGGMRGSKGDSQRAMIIGQMNETLKQRTLFGGPSYTVEYQEVPGFMNIPFMASMQLVYKDAEGNVVPEGLVDAPITVRRSAPPEGSAPPAGSGTTQTTPPAGGAPAEGGTGATAPATGANAGAATAAKGAAAPTGTPTTTTGVAPAPTFAPSPTDLPSPNPNLGPAAIPPLMAPPAPTGGIGPQGVGPTTAAAAALSRGQQTPQAAAAAGAQRVTATPFGSPGTPVAASVNTAGLQPAGVNAVTSTNQPAYVRKGMIVLKNQTLAEMRAQFARWRSELTKEQYEALRAAADSEFPNSKAIKR